MYPESNGSGLIGKRAQEIVKIHLRRHYPDCAFQAPDTGADLKVVLSDGSQPLLIEVKGTASAGIAWPQLKVSSPHSHRLLVENGIPVHRVVGVFSAVPHIYVLRHGADFVLEAEARWAFRPSGVENQLQEDRQRPRQPNSAVVIDGSHLSKDEVLRMYLERQHEAGVTLGFQEAAEVLGLSLPSSAYKYPAFWANQTDTTNRPWARAWKEAGYEVESYQLSDVHGWVRFRRRHDP